MNGSNVLTYDAENRLVSSSGSLGSGTYSYGAFGIRAVKVAGGVTTVSVYDGNHAIAEYTSGTLANEYVYLADQLIASRLSGTLYYHAFDHQSIRVHLDSSGNIVGQKGQYPYGEDWYVSTLTNRHFTTYARDAESANDNALHRFYVNRLARFSSTDPVPGGGGNPQGFNLYSYVHNDPVNQRDSSGRDFDQCDPWTGCGTGSSGGGGGGGGGDCNPDSILEGNSCPPPEPVRSPPPPTPECFCQLKHRTVNVWIARLFHAQHDFWYVQDDTGSQTFLEAGPSTTGFLQLYVIPYPGGPGDTNATAGFTVGPSPQFCYNADLMEFAASTFPQYANVYKPLGPNSNSAAHYLAIVGGFNPSPPFWSPGWNTPIIGSPFVY